MRSVRVPRQNEVKGKLTGLSQDDIAILEKSGLPLVFEDGTSYTIQKDDVIIKTSGVGVLDEQLEKEIAALRLKNKIVIFWDVDAPATLDRVINSEDYFKALIP